MLRESDSANVWLHSTSAKHFLKEKLLPVWLKVIATFKLAYFKNGADSFVRVEHTENQTMHLR